MQALLASNKDALSRAEKMYGKDNINISLNLERLAAVHRLLGQYEHASSLYQRQIAILKKEADSKPKDNTAQANLATAHYNIGITYNSQDDTRQLAKAELEKALDIRKKTFGPSDRHVADSISALAILYASLKQYSNASKLHLQAMEVYHKVMPLVDPEPSLDNGGVRKTMKVSSSSSPKDSKVVKGAATPVSSVPTLDDSDGGSDSDDSTDVGGDDGLSWHEFKVFKQKFATLK